MVTYEKAWYSIYREAFTTLIIFIRLAAIKELRKAA